MDFMGSKFKRKMFYSRIIFFICLFFSPKICKASTSTYFFFFLFQFVQNEVRPPALFLCDKEGLGPHPVSQRRQEKGGTVLLTRYEYVIHMRSVWGDSESVDV